MVLCKEGGHVSFMQHASCSHFTPGFGFCVHFVPFSWVISDAWFLTSACSGVKPRGAWGERHPSPSGHIRAPLKTSGSGEAAPVWPQGPASQQEGPSGRLSRVTQPRHLSDLGFLRGRPQGSGNQASGWASVAPGTV